MQPTMACRAASHWKIASSDTVLRPAGDKSEHTHKRIHACQLRQSIVHSSMPPRTANHPTSRASHRLAQHMRPHISDGTLFITSPHLHSTPSCFVCDLSMTNTRNVLIWLVSTEKTRSIAPMGRTSLRTPGSLRVPIKLTMMLSASSCTQGGTTTKGRLAGAKARNNVRAWGT